MCRPPSLRQCMRRGAFSCGRGDCPAGASPLASPGLNPGGTYSPNKKGTRRGACLVCRLPTMPLVYFLSPIPPTPFPSGEGETKVFSCKGLRPLHPRAEPGRRLQPQQKRYPAGGLPCLPPADHAFSLFSFPHPPDPLPLRGRGRLRFFHARGFAPCIPAPEPEAALAQLKNSVCLRGQCRQPRRGGTGGDGTIRRKRRRRLRWSSPPGQG